MAHSLLFFSGFTKPSWHLLRKNQDGGKRHSLANQWLGLCTFTARAWVWFLVGKLRCHKLPGKAKKKKRVAHICPVGHCIDAMHPQFGTLFLFCITNILGEVVKSTNFINFNPEYRPSNIVREETGSTCLLLLNTTVGLVLQKNTWVAELPAEPFFHGVLFFLERTVDRNVNITLSWTFLQNE